MLTVSAQPELRSLGVAFLAELQLAQGRWVAARQSLRDAVARGDEWATTYNAYFAALPFVAFDTMDAGSLERGLSGWRRRARPAATADDEMYNLWDPRFRPFVVGLLRAKRGDEAGARRSLAMLESTRGSRKLVVSRRRSRRP